MQPDNNPQNSSGGGFSGHTLPLAEIFSRSPVPAFAFNGDGNIVFLNDAMEYLTGIEHDSVETVDDLFGYLIIEKEQRTRLNDQFDNFLSGEAQTVTTSIVTVTDEGLGREFEITTFPVVESDGRSLVIICLCREVPDLRTIERALLDSENRYRSLFRKGKTINLLIDPDTGIIRDVSETACEFYGYSPDEIIGININEINILSPAAIAEEMELAKKENRNYYYFKHRCADGTIRNVEVYSHPLEIDGETLLYSIVHDITEKKKLEEQLRIREKIDSLGTLAGGFAHDFNNLLASIMGNVDLISMNSANLTGEQIKSLKAAMQSCRHAATLVRDIQILSKGMMTSLTDIDVYSLIREVFDIFEHTAESSIRKDLNIRPGAIAVLGDVSQLRQAFLQIVSNAMQAIREKGPGHGDHIRADARNLTVSENQFPGCSPGEYVSIRLGDTGAGMTEDVKLKAFDPLFTTQQRSYEKGKGLGLSMVYNIIVNMHKGFVTLESDPGEGTTVEVILPRSKTVPRKTTGTSALSGGEERILVIDDEEGIRSFLKRALGQLGYSVTVEKTGTAGLGVLERSGGAFDLILVDPAIEDMSGIDVIEHILREYPRIRVLVASGHDEKALEKIEDVDGYIVKPFRMKELAEKIRLILE